MFKKYNSIENSYREAFVNLIIEAGYGDKEYIVQEKAHGSNLSFSTEDGEHFTAYKRSGDIEADEKFYNYKFVLSANIDKFKNIWVLLKSKYTDLFSLTLFGELIGGDYSHRDIKRDKNAIKVQKGIFYCPQNSFYAFDIFINNERYLDVDEAVSLFEEVGLIHAKTLFKGNLEACLKYPNAFESTIYQQFNLPRIEDNICEGVVIRPQESCFLVGGSRVILKNKNEKWEEKSKSKRKPKEKIEETDEIKQLKEELLAYVTENRFANVVSKIGPISKQEIRKYIGLYKKDIFTDFNKDYGVQMDNLTKPEQKLITNSINKTVSKIVVNYIDKN